MSSEYIQFIVLKLLYEKFESRQHAWPVVNDLLDNDELRYFERNEVATEIDYLAEEKILTGGSGTGYAPFTQVKINGPGLRIVRFILKEFPKYIAEMEDQDCKRVFRQVSAMHNEKGKQLEIFGFINQKPNFFEDFVEKTNAISSSPIPFNSSKPPKGNIIMYTGDVFKDIQNSTIISKSNVESAFNRLPAEEPKKAYVELTGLINKSQNPAAGAIFDSFSEELKNPTPDKMRLQKLGEGIQQVLPSVTAIAGCITKILSYFN